MKTKTRTPQWGFDITYQIPKESPARREHNLKFPTMTPRPQSPPSIPPKKVAKTAKVDTPKKAEKAPLVLDGVVIAIRGVPEALEARVRQIVEAHAKISGFDSVQEHQQTGEILAGKKHVTIVLSSDEASGRAACDALKAVRKSELGAPDMNPYVRRPLTEGTPSDTLVIRTETALTEEQVKAAIPKAETVTVFPSYEWYLARVKFASVEDAVLAKTNLTGPINSVKVTHVSYQGGTPGARSAGAARGGRGGFRGGRGASRGGARGGFRGGRGGSRGGFRGGRGGRGGSRGGEY